VARYEIEDASTLTVWPIGIGKKIRATKGVRPEMPIAAMGLEARP